jgi:hypothetical protein
MKGNAHRYALRGDISVYGKYLSGLQAWGKGLLGKPSVNKHGTTVACHSVFCRRTPFMHVALAEAMWNPGADTRHLTEALVSFLQKNGGLPGFVGEAGAGRDMAQHDAVGKRVSLAKPYSPRYTGGGAAALTNGRRATRADAADWAWQGFEKNGLDATVHLEKPMSINGLSAGFLNQPPAGVGLPEAVEYSVSRDGGATFQNVGSVERPAGIKGNVRNEYRLNGLDLYKVTHVRVRASVVKHWLFVDEILVNPLGQADSSHRHRN